MLDGRNLDDSVQIKILFWSFRPIIKSSHDLFGRVAYTGVGFRKEMSCDMRFPTMWYVQPTKFQTCK